ncbi:redoxin domain-containing protein [Lignipirellula cremea]|uniref:Thiol-disulfide oxidoreductase ResA n=1 Tax=Lignipirellula cremea TaxID=2528010 RepID=A0A518DZF5_9BACT|nr:redoxin domain-containing protein [Lignipirellula cremea]QDU97224.1 Thiol-disulfide oxidoreductase ResA [Lignipirellula cremea]
MILGPLERSLSAALLTLPLLCLTSAVAADPSVSQALKLAPIQSEVDYQQPTDEEAEKCTIKSESTEQGVGWVLYDHEGRLLRKFLDSNRDKKVDLWCYYRNGVEVYRDIDADFNSKADQYRWLGPAGIRWGLDTNEDGSVDSWRAISAQEVSAEVVAALRDGDVRRFRLLLPTREELQSAGLGSKMQEQITEQANLAIEKFPQLASQQKKVSAGSKWIHFGATRPGVVPQGVDGNQRDLTVYDSVAAMVETDGKHEQINLGGMVQIGDAWRLLGHPQGLLGEPTQAGLFFGDPLANMDQVAVDNGGPQDDQSQEVIREIEGLESQIAKGGSAVALARLHDQRCDALERLIRIVASDEDRGNWIRQYADTVTTAMQANVFPNGQQRLERMLTSLKQEPDDANLAAYVQFRLMTLMYAMSLQAADADFAKIQDNWLKELTAFVEEYPTSTDAPDAMLQLALAEEFAGKEEAAKAWYGRIATNFPQSPLAAKAVGAARRIDSVGKPVAIAGKTLGGQQLSLAQFRGRVVLVHYWATWCEPCKEDMNVFRSLLAKYGAQGFSVLGVCLDSDADAAANYLRTVRAPWEHLYEEGGLDSRLANELGVLTLPTTLLIDKDGKVISRSINAGELDAELPKRLR